MAKKVNPRKRPLSEADALRKEKRLNEEKKQLLEAVRQAKKDMEEQIDEIKEDTARTVFEWVCAMNLVMLHDKFGYDQSQLKRYWDEINNLCDSISKGYCSVPDLKDVLRDELDIELDIGGENNGQGAV